MSNAVVLPAPPLAFPSIDGWSRWTTDVCASLMTWTHDRSPEGTERYAAALALWAQLMPAPPPTPLLPVEGAARDVEFGVVAFERPLMVSRWKMAPGATQPAHCHPHTVNCTLLVGGSVHLISFDAIAPPLLADRETEFGVLCIGETVLRAGELKTLTPTRGNLHQIEAGPAGAEGFEFTTMYARTSEFSYIDWVAPRREPPLVGTRAMARWAGPHAPARSGTRKDLR